MNNQDNTSSKWLDVVAFCISSYPKKMVKRTAEGVVNFNPVGHFLGHSIMDPCSKEIKKPLNETAKAGGWVRAKIIVEWEEEENDKIPQW